MTIDVFTEQEFVAVLDRIVSTDPLPKYGQEPIWCVIDATTGTESKFIIPLKKFQNGLQIHMHIMSSVNSFTGVSDGAGENSIRAWLADQDGQPLGNKTQRWVTRQPGWQNRFEAMFRKLVSLADHLRYCHACGTIEKIFTVKKEGANKGRLFKKCNCTNSFHWLDEYEQTDEIDTEIPSCPNCGSQMKKRTGKFGEFWGCSTFPTCKGTRNIGQETTAPEEFSRRAQVREDVVEAKKQGFQATTEQQNLFDWVERTNDLTARQNLIVEAGAGTGKTTTGMKMFARVPREQKSLYLAFNANIKKEAAMKFRSKGLQHVIVKTYHGFGFSILSKAYNLNQNAVDGDKLQKLLDTYWDKNEFGHLAGMVKRIISALKNSLLDPTEESMQMIVDHHDIEVNGDRDIVFLAAEHLYHASLAIKDVIDFDDMIAMPVLFNLPSDTYDFIFIDEAQDTNGCQLQLVSKAVGPTTRVVAVGDVNQAIYGFRGADIRAIDNIQEAFDAIRMPLTTTFRNPLSVVRLVNETFPNIPLHAVEGAKEGEVLDIHYDVALNCMKDGDLVLCRMNAPLVRPALGLIRKGTKAVILGSEIGTGLIQLIDKMKATDIGDLQEKLGQYLAVEYTKLLDADKKSKAAALRDKIETIEALCDGYAANQSVDVVRQRINLIFTNDAQGVVFSTVHKAKGREAENVYLLKPELMPHPNASEGWQYTQELNIQYVAYTRAMTRLAFVYGE